MSKIILMLTIGFALGHFFYPASISAQGMLREIQGIWKINIEVTKKEYPESMENAVGSVERAALYRFEFTDKKIVVKQGEEVETDSEWELISMNDRKRQLNIKIVEPNEVELTLLFIDADRISMGFEEAGSGDKITLILQKLEK